MNNQIDSRTYLSFERSPRRSVQKYKQCQERLGNVSGYVDQLQSGGGGLYTRVVTEGAGEGRSSVSMACIAMIWGEVCGFLAGLKGHLSMGNSHRPSARNNQG